MAVSAEDLLPTPAAYATPSQVAAARQQAQQMSQQANSNEKIQSPYQGFARITQALMGGLLEQDADRQEALGRTAAAIESGALFGPGSMAGQSNLVGAGGANPGAGGAHVSSAPVTEDIKWGAGVVPMAAAKAAIAGNESGGRYGEIGPVVAHGSYAGDRAYGKYQVMGKDLADRLAKAGLPNMSPSQFLASPQAQELEFESEFGGLMAKHGSFNDAASMWFSGHPMRANDRSSDGWITTPNYINRANRTLQQWFSDPRNNPAAARPPQPGQVMSDAGPIGGPGAQLAMAGAGTGMSPLSAVPIRVPTPGQVPPLLNALQRGYGGPPIVPSGTAPPPPPQQVAANAPPPSPGAVPTPQGVVQPPQFRQPAPPIAQAGPPQMPARDPRTGELYPVDPNGVFPLPQNNAAFMRYMQNPWREVFDPGSTARIQQMFQPRTIEDVNGNQWVYSPNQLPYKVKSTFGKPVEVDVGGGIKLQGYDRVGSDGQIHRYVPMPEMGGAGAPPPGEASTGGVTGPLGPIEGIREEIRQGEARAAGLKTVEEKAADARQVPVTAAIQRGPTAQKEVELLNTMDILSRQTPQALSGPLADTFVELGKGLKEITNGALGWDTASAEGIQKLGGQLASLAAREITNRPALAEFKTMVLSNPGIYNSVAGRAMLIDLIRQSAQQDVKLADMATNADARQWPTMRQAFYNDPKNSLTLHYKGKSYAANADGIAQFSHDIAPAQEGGPQRIGSQREYDELPEGRQYIGSDGKTRTKQGKTQ
jgi:hypothetical protein